MIAGVEIHPLKIIRDERGQIMHMLRNDAGHFTKFGEIYFSMVFPQRVKAWHIHKEMTLNYAVPFGEILLVLHDDRAGSPTKGETMQIPLGDPNYSLVKVPPMVWNGFMGRGNFPALVANCSDIPHDPKEIGRIAADDPRVPYQWPAEIRFLEKHPHGVAPFQGA